MAIQPTQEELDGLLVLSGAAQNAQLQLQKVRAAQQAFISLLENKYDAELDKKTGELLPKKKGVDNEKTV